RRGKMGALQSVRGDGGGGCVGGWGGADAPVRRAVSVGPATVFRAPAGGKGSRRPARAAIFAGAPGRTNAGGGPEPPRPPAAPPASPSPAWPPPVPCPCSPTNGQTATASRPRTTARAPPTGSSPTPASTRRRDAPASAAGSAVAPR